MGYEDVLLHFNEAFLVKNENETEFFLKCSLFNNPLQQPSCCIGSGIDEILNEYILQVKRELQNDEEFGKEQILRNYLKSFRIQIQRRKNKLEKSFSQRPELLGEKKVQLVRFVNLIDENYKKGFTVAEYSRLLHISSRSLSDLTQQLLNKTPS